VPELSLQAKIHSTVDGWQMLPRLGSSIVLMVSGGADSVAMTHLLTRLYPEYDYTILHVNHGIRESDADADEAFVVALAEELSIPCEVARLDLPAVIREEGGNLEELGRKQRYQLAVELLDRLQAGSQVIQPAAQSAASTGRIATAHTANDQAETFLMRVIKGGGPTAWSGIAAIRDNIIRPMIDLTHAELTDWLRVNNLEWREDATNRDTRYFRAFVRHQLIPLMQTHNPRLVETINRSLKILSAQSNYIVQAAMSFVDDPLEAGDTALIRQALRQAYRSAGGDTSALTFEQVEKLRLQAQNPGFFIDLPGGISAGNISGQLRFFSAEENAVRNLDWTKQEPFISLLLPDQRLITPAGDIMISELDPAVFADDPVIYARTHSGSSHLIVDSDVLEAYLSTDTDAGQPTGLAVSSLRPGDRFSPLGMNGHTRLVSDLLIDRKVARFERSKLLKLTANGQIVWIIGVAADDRFKAKSDSRRLSSIIVGF
jgi:tRNA(Ile)-lysidine synthase